MCGCAAHHVLVDCTCQCDHTNDRLIQWRQRAQQAEAALAARDAEIERLRGDVKWTRSECAKADAENNAAGERAKQAEAALQRAREELTTALAAWEPEHEYNLERARRKGYAHNQVAAEMYGDAIDRVSKALAALDQPKETS